MTGLFSFVPSEAGTTPPGGGNANGSTISSQLYQWNQSKLAERQNQIEALTADLQKVSAQLEMSKPAPQTILNNY
jgi:hypothetical protein